MAMELSWGPDTSTTARADSRPRTHRSCVRGVTYCLEGPWALRGALDRTALESFCAEVEAMARRVPGSIVVDLSGVRSCDAAGLELLSRLGRAARHPVVLRAAPACVREALAGALVPALSVEPDAVDGATADTGGPLRGCGP